MPTKKPIFDTPLGEIKETRESDLDTILTKIETNNPERVFFSYREELDQVFISFISPDNRNVHCAILNGVDNLDAYRTRVTEVADKVGARFERGVIRYTDTDTLAVCFEDHQRWIENVRLLAEYWNNKSSLSCNIHPQESWLQCDFPHNVAICTFFPTNDTNTLGYLITELSKTGRADTVSYTHLTLPTIYSV